MNKLSGASPLSPSALVVAPAPTADRSAAQVRGSYRYPTLITPENLRTGMRVGRWVLVGERPVQLTAAYRILRSVNVWGFPIPERMPSLNDVRWLCHCDCGTERSVCVNALICASSLSCGCFRTDRCAYLTAERNRARRTDFSGQRAA